MAKASKPKKITTHTWNLTPLYTSLNDPQIQKDLKHAKALANRFVKKYKGKDFVNNDKLLYESLKDYEALNLSKNSGHLPYYYFYLSHAINLNNEKIQRRLNQAEEITTEIANLIRFYTIKLAKTPKQRQKKILNNKRFAKYHPFLKQLFKEGKYMLSEKEENIITLLSTSAYTRWTQMVQKFINRETITITINGKKQTLPINQASKYLHERNNKLRRYVTQKISKAHHKYADVATEELNAILYTHKVSLKLRGFRRPDEPSLLKDMVDTDFVDTLRKVHQEFLEYSHRFYRLKQKLLRVKKFYYNDRIANVGKLDLKFSWQKALKFIYKTLKDFDNTTYQIAKQLIEEGRVDVYPRPNKRGGAFCTVGNVDAPVYILLNHKDTVTSLTTFAHELGHAINHTLINKTQSPLYTSLSLAVAEVSSNFFEGLVRDRLINTVTDPKTRFLLCFEKLSDFVSSFFRQLALYNFELEIHQKLAKTGYISKEEFNNLFKKHMKSYMGDHTHFTEYEKAHWVAWHHIRYFFYVYSYASGQIIAQSLLTKYYKDKNFKNAILEYLKHGTDKTPYEIFADLGINIKDINFYREGLNHFVKELEEVEKQIKILT